MNAPERNRRIGEGERIRAGRLRVFRDGRWDEVDGDRLTDEEFTLAKQAVLRRM